MARGLNLKGLFSSRNTKSLEVSRIMSGSGTNRNPQVVSGDIWRNSAVSSCIQWTQRTFPEAHVCLLEGSGGELTPIFKHPLVYLLRNPNPQTTDINMWQSILFSLYVSGNAYLHKARIEDGTVSELWYIPHWSIKPKVDDMNTIVEYEYSVRNKRYQIPAGDIIHIRMGVDATYPWMGVSPFEYGRMDIGSDNEATVYTYSILKGMGIPGVVLNPKDPDVEIGESSREQLRRWWKESFTGDNRGEPLVPSVPLDVEKIGITPEEMALDNIRKYPEDRICALGGLSSMVVGLTTGHGSKSYANYREAMDAAIENSLIPLHSLIGAALGKSLIPEYSDLNVDDFSVGWFYGYVWSMQGQKDKSWLRWTTAFRSGLVTLNEARLGMGLPPLEGDDGNIRVPLTSLTNRDVTSLIGGQDNEGDVLGRPKEPGQPIKGLTIINGQPFVR